MYSRIIKPTAAKLKADVRIPRIPWINSAWRYVLKTIRRDPCTDANVNNVVLAQSSSRCPRTNHQSALTARALQEWDIRKGCTIVQQIRFPFLLRRIARSARQDAIRLEAALRLNNKNLIVDVARNTKDISLRWQGALYLDDPILLTEVALFKPTDHHLEETRDKAHQALIRHLDNLREKGHTDQLIAYLCQVDHTPYKIEAFLRLPALLIRPSILEHMAIQDYRFTPDDLIKNLFVKIQASRWFVIQTRETTTCKHCRGFGHLMSSGCAADGRIPSPHSLPCPECHATGEVVYRKISCSRKDQATVLFRLLEIET